MAASYPGAVKTFSAIINGVTKLVAALFNSPYDEITAIETELGANVAGSVTDLVARLTVFLNDNGTSKVNCDDYGTAVSSPAAKTLENVMIQWGYMPSIASAGTHIVTGLPFTSATSYSVTISRTAGSGSGEHLIVRDSGSQFTFTNNAGDAATFMWIAIGV